MPGPLDFATITAGRRPSAAAKTPPAPAPRAAATSAAAPSLDDLVPESARKPMARLSRKARSSSIPPEFSDTDIGQALDITLYWTLTTCDCGATYTAPRYSQSSAFARIRHRHHVELRPVLSPHAHPGLPIREEWDEQTVHSCPTCIHMHHSQLPLPLDLEPLSVPHHHAPAPTDQRHLPPSSTPILIAFRTPHYDDEGELLYHSYAIYEETNYNGLRRTLFRTVSYAPWAKICEAYPGIVEVDPYPRVEIL